MSDGGEGTRMRKPGSTSAEEEEKPSSSSAPNNNEGSGADKEKKPGAVGDIYNRLVDSFERSLNAVVKGESSEPPPRLASQNLEGIAAFIKKEKPKSVIVMTGAGISTAAGIPDFRSPGTGLYDNLAEYKLSDPQDIFDISFFRKQPDAFFKLAKALFPKDIKPTPSHYFVRLLEKKGLLRRWFTQNIDSLENLSGVDKDRVVAAHGSHASSTCLKCKAIYDLHWITKILEDPDQLVAHCEKEGCDGVVKPDIVFFGENLPKRFFECVIKDFPRCDLLIIMGTSLKVHPFAGLVDEVAGDVPRLLINMEPAGHFGAAERLAAMEMCYGGKKSKRDVFWRGKCDDGVRKLAELLGWDEELDILIEQGPPSRSLL